MSRAGRPVLFVGGVGGQNAEEVLRLAGPEVGDLALGLTDGETGPRRLWVLYLWNDVFRGHPSLEYVPPKNWPPRGYGDLPKFKLRAAVEEIHFDALGYADFAIESFATFRRLRDEGVIPQGTRFQVCIPFPEDAVRLCTLNARDFQIMQRAYCDVVRREVAKIADAISPEELVFQWDINWEVIAIETDDGGKEEPLGYRLDGQPLERFAGYLQTLSAAVPAAAQMGLHLCYGDFMHQHYLQPQDLSVCVRMANRAVEASSHPIAYVHMPVPRDRADGAYFEPLAGLAIDPATLYIGLVHFTDGLAGSAARLETFRQHYAGPAGVATECGMGRRPPDQDMRTLLRIHRDLAERL